MLGSLDPAKVLVILVVALIVLGPERLPRAARQLGAAWRELTRLRDQVTDEVRSAIPDVDIPRIPHGAVSGFVRDLTRPSTAPHELEEAVAPAELSDGVSTDRRTYQGDLPAGAGALSPIPAQPAGATGAFAPVAHDDPGMN